MSERDHSHEGHGDTPEDEIAIAEEALAEGDHPHAARHVAGALAHDPSRAEWRALLDRIVDEAEDARALFQVERGGWFGEIAGQAHVLAHLGETQAAIDLVAQVAAFVPRRGYQSWLAEWLVRHRGRFDPGQTLHALASLSKGTVGFLKLRASERALFERWVPVALALVARPDGDALRAETLTIGSGVLRRAGRHAEAVQAARRATRTRESDMAYSALGLALRAEGQWDAAVEAFRQGGRLAPGGPFAAERARTLLDAGRLADAERELPTTTGDVELDTLRAWLARRLRNGAPSKSGWFTRAFSRTEAAPDPRTLALAARLPEVCDADAFRLVSVHGTAALPVPCDATANFVRQVFAKKKDGSWPKGPGNTVKLSSEVLEAPSARMAACLALGERPGGKALEYEFTTVPRPDPRRPRRPVRDVIWIYRGPEKRDVGPALPPPGEGVARILASVVGTPYFLPRWWQLAREHGPELGPEGVDEILGAMIHPPLPPADLDVDAAEWVFRHQVAGAFLLAHVDGGWKDSRRRQVLFSLVDGTLDWTTDAAILALRELALDEPEALPEIEERFWTLKGEVPRPGHPWFAATLAWSYLRLPGSPADRVQQFEKLVQQIYKRTRGNQEDDEEQEEDSEGQEDDDEEEET